MVRYKKLFIWFILGVVFFIALLIGIGISLPYLINLEPLKEKISKTISQQADVKISYQRLDLFYFPLPHVKLQQIRFLIPEKAEGLVKGVEVYPEWLSLVKGTFRIRRIHLESPDVNLRLLKGPDETKEKIEPELFKKIQEMSAQTSVIVPKMEVIIKEGRGSLVLEPKFPLSISDLEARWVFSSETSRIEMACRSNLWKHLNFSAIIEPKSFKGSGHLEVKNLALHTLFNAFLPNSPFPFKEARSDLKISFNTEGTSHIKAEVEVFSPSFTLRTSDGDRMIKTDRLKGAFWMKGSKIEANLREWNFKDPQLNLSGRIQMDRAIPSIHIEIEGRKVEVISTRRMILALTAKNPNIQRILGYVRGGTLPQVSLRLTGKSFADLAKPENMILQGRMTEGHVFVPIPLLTEPLELHQVRGEVMISKGILLTKNIAARWENSHVQGAELNIGLIGKETPFHMEAWMDIDFSQLPPLLRQILKKNGPLQEIHQIKQLKGRARLQFVLGETLSALKVKASLQDIRLVAHYGRIPFPLSIDGGESSYEGEKLSFRNLKGTVGRSSFSGLTAELNLKKEPSLEVQSGECAIMLEEFSSWIFLRDVFKNLLKETESLRGIVCLSRMRMNGPLDKPKNWHFETAGDWQGISLNPHAGPGVITSPRGKFRADTQTITFSDVESQMLNASLRVSGGLSNFLDGLDRVELDIEGKVTPQEIQWLLTALKVKREIPIRSPLSLSKAHLSWRRKGETSFRGDVMVEKGPKVYLNLIQKSGQLKVDPLTLRDETSNCSIALDLKEGLLKVEFSGELFEQTLDKIFLGYQFQNGRLMGDFRAHIMIDQPIRSTIQGRLEADELSFPWQFQKPLEIEHITLRGEGSLLSVGKARLSWGGMALSLSGKGRFSEKGLLIDIDLSAGHLDFKQITESFKKEKSDKGDQDPSTFQVEGTIRFKANSFQYGRFIWKPFWTNITIGPKSVEAKVMEASLCGVSTLGVVRILGEELSFDIYPAIKARQLNQVLSCLQGEEIRMTGVVDLKGRLFSKGQPQELLQSLKGDLELQAKNGQIYDMVVLSRILELINITEIYRGKLPDLKKEGLLYHLIVLKGSFHNGKFVIKEATLDGKTLEMVAKGELDLINEEMKLTVLVAPLKTVDRIIKFIPLVRDILAGTLISIPVDVRGRLKDPKVSYLSPTAIGEELVEMMKRTLRLPFKLFEPFLPPKKEEGEVQQEP